MVKNNAVVDRSPSCMKNQKSTPKMGTVTKTVSQGTRSYKDGSSSKSNFKEASKSASQSCEMYEPKIIR